MIYGLSGYAKAGKDTLAAELVRRDGFIRVSFADALRECMYRLNPIVDAHLEKGGTVFSRYADIIDGIGYSKAKLMYPEIRELLQRLGTEAGREVLGNDIWVDVALKGLDINLYNYVVTDVRFDNEYQAILSNGGINIRIERPGFGPANQHCSETALDGYVFDFVLQNDGSIEELYNEFKTCIG